MYVYVHNLFAPQQASSPSPPRHGRLQKRPPLSLSSPKTSRTALTSLLDPGRCGGGDGIVELAAEERNSARRTDDVGVATGVLRELAGAYVSANRTTQCDTMITFSPPPSRTPVTAPPTHRPSRPRRLRDIISTRSSRVFARWHFHQRRYITAPDSPPRRTWRRPRYIRPPSFIL